MNRQKNIEREALMVSRAHQGPTLWRKEYTPEELAVSAAHERDLVARAERAARRLQTQRDRAAVEEWAAYRASVRARLK